MTGAIISWIRRNSIALLALFLALGGTTYAATGYPANIIGAKQLKKDAVTNVKIHKRAVTGAKVALNTITGANILESSLGKVTSAASADQATSADSATTAATATNIAPPEAWHEVGAPGEPAFQNSWTNETSAANETVAFYKDRQGTVHLKGVATGGAPTTLIFQLPSGYRPASGRLLNFAVLCTCETADPQGGIINLPTGGLIVFGAGVAPNADGGVGRPLNMQVGGAVGLNGIAFRAAG
jgi:hypothetical protein